MMTADLTKANTELETLRAHSANLQEVNTEQAKQITELTSTRDSLLLDLAGTKQLLETA